MPLLIKVLYIVAGTVSPVSAAVIGGSVAGGIVAIAVLILLSVYIYKRRVKPVKRFVRYCNLINEEIEVLKNRQYAMVFLFK